MRISCSSSSSMRTTPARPAAAMAKPVSRPMPTASAPRIIALTTSAPRRIPPSTITSARPAAARTTSGRTSIAPRPWSSWRPPWLDT